jgi:long-chain acyl-CoA synthetase
MDKVWLNEYPPGVPSEINPDRYGSLLELIDESLQTWSERAAYRFMGQAWRFADLDRLSRAFAAWLQQQGMVQGDAVAVMLPNLPQYPVAVLGILRAGMVVVNVNPLYTARELRHQLADSGARAIVVAENFAATLQQSLEGGSPLGLRHVLLTAIGDMLAWPRSQLVNLAVRHVRKLVPPFELPQAVGWREALAQGQRRTWQRPVVTAGDVAVLQYTGGTTGVSKGAMLSHRNIVANLLQAEAWNAPVWSRLPDSEQPLILCALPLYHVFGFTVCMMLGLKLGTCNLLIVNPRDLAGLLKELARQPVHSFPGVNTLFHALVHHPQFEQADWSRLLITAGGGMAVQQATARLWQERTGVAICEGYGLSETAPCVTCNITSGRQFTGNVGLPIPSTEVAIVDDAGEPLPLGASGEIAVRGPQVMLGYWQRPDETAQAFTASGRCQ